MKIEGLFGFSNVDNVSFNFSAKEKKSVEECIKKIKNYFDIYYLSIVSFKGTIEIHFYDNEDTKVGLYLDFDNRNSTFFYEGVSGFQKYFCQQENQGETSKKYDVAFNVVANWKKIKVELDSFINRSKSIERVCKEFEV
ncbi:MAG: hypothetical protein N4A40_13050 [Tissierellales bacterium]|jgi:hypothetical protein|nr:hypothetical protein [Tissierellales bacterium]